MGNFYRRRTATKNEAPVASNSTKSFVLPGDLTLSARHMVIPHSELSKCVEIHPLNPRFQEALNEESLSDILPSIKTSGILFEGVAEQIGEKYYILDASRRLNAAILTGQDLPLWVFDTDSNLTRRQAEYITEIARKQRPLSYREEGALLINAIKERPELADLKLLMTEFRYQPTQERTVRRYLDAAVISPELINLFPDSEGIPNDFYAKLKSLSKQVGKNNECKANKEESFAEYFERLNPIVNEWANSVKSNISLSEDLSTSDKQKVVLETLTTDLYGAPKKPEAKTWSDGERMFSKNKWTYADVQRHKNGRELKIHTKQLTKAQEEQLLNLIQSFA